MDLKKGDNFFETDKTLLAGSANAQFASAAFIPQDGDSIERITTLGAQLTNPYLIPNMQQAYRNLGYDPALATVTNLYVRFKPTTAQLATLDSIMDVRGLELFDTPVDYDVTYEGDYYQDPSIPDSLPTWQYAVVPPTFIFPAGIINETLAQIHIPGDSYTAIEAEAENLAAGGGSYQVKGTPQPDVPQCDVGYHWDYTLLQCVPNNCPEGYKWNGTACVLITCPTGYYYNGTTCVAYQTVPPPPAADAAIPAGYIYVHDTNLPSLPNGSDLPLRKVRVVARRWFKEERVFTDNSGHFTCTKKFRHNVRIIEKFKNADAYVYGLRGPRLWQMAFPVKRTFGIFSGNKNNLMLYNNQQGAVNSKANRYWVAATVHNAVQEHNDYATQFHFAQMPATMHIFITSWASYAGLSSAPLFRERKLFGFIPPIYFVSNFMVNPIKNYIAGLTVAVANISAEIGVDMVLDYSFPISDFLSDRIKEVAYHEMSHASHYSKVGNVWYGNFVTKELNETQIHSSPSDPLNPYGPSTSGDADMIALGEGWAYHMGHFLADQRYGVNASRTSEGQGNFDPTMNPPLTAHPHINVLEAFNPNLTADPFKWIPKGLMEDLIDNTPNETAPVIDNVNGFTTSQLFNALQSDVTTVPQYRDRFIQQNSGNQTANVTNLFAQYHY